MNLDLRSSAVELEDLPLLLQRLRELGFDSIRYASYRTAAKLRYIQKECNVDLLDVWNVIESFRENGLNALEPSSLVTLTKLESILVSLYVNLKKRLPPGHEVDIRSSVRVLISWLVIAYDSECSGHIRVFSVKVGLITLCNGKLVDKLRYIFTQISDPLNGKMLMRKFGEYLEEVLALPAMVLESPTFPYREDLASLIFNGTTDIPINKFLETLLADPGPLCLIWMPLLDVIGAVENVTHPVSCSVCRSPSIQGLRYKCQKCSNFNLCQNCFWQGKTTASHRNDHEVKEYSNNKPSPSSLRSSIRKSFRLAPKEKKMPQFQEQPERPLNLAYIVASNRSSVGSCAESLNSESDEEHRLIARYTARLASEAKYSKRMSTQMNMNLFDNTQTQREMIAQLEAKNRDIVREIARLRYQQEVDPFSGDSSVETIVMDELVTLRYHESDLEEKLSRLKLSRDHLMGQIEGLMKLLRAQQSLPSASEASTKSSSYNVGGVYGNFQRIRSAPTTPQHTNQVNSFLGVGGELRSAFSTEEDFNSMSSEASSSLPLRNDLLMAADSVTHAMSSLVKELNAEEEESLAHAQWNKEQAIRQLAEEEKYLEQLRNLRLSEGDSDLDLEEQVNDLLYSKCSDGRNFKNGNQVQDELNDHCFDQGDEDERQDFPEWSRG